MINDYDDEKLTHVPAPGPMDWIACAIALGLCAALLVALGGGFA